MPFTVNTSTKVEKFLNNLDPINRKRIIERFLDYRNYERPLVKHFVWIDQLNCWRDDIGRYRALISDSKENDILLIVKIKIRKETTYNKL